MPQDIKSIFIKARTKASFQELLNSGNVKNTLIAFILDTKEIWTLGVYFPCPYSLEEIDEKFESGLKYKGLLQSFGANALKASSYKSGWCWKWHEDDGTFAGEPVEEGDLILCISDKSGNYKDSDFTILQENLDVHTLTEDDINYLTSDSWPAVSIDLDVEDNLPNIGETVTVEGSVDNIGTVVLTNLRISERDGKIESDYTKQSLAVNAHDTTLLLQHQITEEDILAGECVLNFIVTAQNKFLEVQGDTQVSVETADLDTTLNVNIFMYDANDPICLGETITYGLTIENAGNVTYHNIVLTCDYPDFHRIINKLDTGETTDPIFIEHTVTEEDILNGSIVATVSATSDEILDPKDPENPKTPEGGDTCTTWDEDDPDGAVPPIEDKNGHLTIYPKTTSETPEGGYKLGDTVDYEIIVTNDGNLTITDIKVTSERTGFDEFISTLMPGSLLKFTDHTVVEEADILNNEIVYPVEGSGTSPDPNLPDVPVDPNVAIDDPEDPNGHLTVILETTSEAPEGGYALNDTITYNLYVVNDGNLTITDIELDCIRSDFSDRIVSLVPGGSSDVYQIDTIVTEEDISSGHIINEATVKGLSPDPDKPRVTDIATTDDEPIEL